MSNGIAEYSTAELLVVEMSRHLVDGERALIGTAQPLPMAAIRLAQLTHAPNISFSAAGSGAVNPAFDRLPPTAMDTRAYIGAEGRHTMEHNVDWELAARWDFVFFGGMQVDKFGNVNLVCIGPYDKPKVRGPGAVGTVFMATFRKVYLLVERHERRSIVDKVDFISGVGFLNGGNSRFEVLRPECKGPQLVFTNRCVMDFEEVTRRLRLKSVHPGRSVDEVVANTGCELIVPGKVAVTNPPTGEELEILRTQVDRDGMLKKYPL